MTSVIICVEEIWCCSENVMYEINENDINMLEKYDEYCSSVQLNCLIIEIVRRNNI